MKLFIFTFYMNVWGLVQASNILIAYPTPFYSHQTTYRPLWRELAKRGHKLTLITTDFMEHNENITQIDFSVAYELYEKHDMKTFFKQGASIYAMIEKVIEATDDLIKLQLTHPGIVDLLRNRKQFDLMFAEMLNPMVTVFSVEFGCPLIELYSMDAPPYLHALVGNAIHPAIYAWPIFDFHTELTFKDRLVNTIFICLLHVMKDIVFAPIANKYIRMYVGEDFPDIFDIEKSASLIFVNANPIFYPIRPVTPVTINVGGGVHLTKPQALSQDLQSYLDEAKHGCVYFSFGSNVNSNYLTSEALEIFRKTFEELAPIKVLWKFQNETMALKPNNVELRKWLPQQDILRHPNVKVFITQGGLQSMEEAIDSAVPMLGMPFYGDQINNVNKMVVKEFGMRLDVKTMDGNSLRTTLLELMNNSKYKKNIDRLSRISKDQPMSGLEKAVWWTEYVLRHGTTEHMRSPSADIPLYQYFFLDIIAFLCIVFIFLILVLYYSFKLIRSIFRVIFCKKNKVKVN